MSAKHIDPKEFRDLGFLQEANRQFFHPHGLALEVTAVTADDGKNAFSTISLLDREMQQLKDLIAEKRKRGVDLSSLESRLDQATRHEEGDVWISGVWDYRDDPESIVFGSGDYGDSQERADRTRAERLKHAEARAELFHGATPQLKELGATGIERHSLDIEPLDYIYPDQAT